jgi:uncharacterized NAD(P)/FAD-binding protein YdhS
MGMMTEPAALRGGGASTGARIAVIGAGVSGVLTAIHLLWRCRPEDKVYLVEKSARLGPGVAYGTRHPRHLVNVRADNMSAFADEPDHFARWLARLPDEERAAAGRKTMAGLFVRRDVYGRYVQELLGDAIIRQGGFQNLYIVTDHATALHPAAAGPGLVMETEGGRTYELDAAVLAVGNLPPVDPELPGYVADPWAEGALDGVAPGRPVLLLGTGLTAVDVLLLLQDRGFAGPVVALSRRGLLPRAHAPASPWSDLRLEPADRRSAAALARAARREVARAKAAGVDWRCVIDALRPQVRAVWRELPDAERARFVRHLRPYWDVHRHRMAPPVAEAVEAALRSGALEVAAGRIEAVEPAGPPGGGLRVRWRPRGGGGDAERELTAQLVVDCRGPAADYARIADPLVRQLLADGLARPDPHRLGLETTWWGHLVGRDGGSSQALLGVGPVTRGTFWETTSVPDIRGQAEQVAVSALAAARKAVQARAG